MTPPAPARCPACGTELAPSLLACPACGALAHASRLRELAAAAERQASDGDPAAAIASWREALQLLPPGTAQAEQVGARIEALLKERPAAGRAKPRRAPGVRKGVVATIAALVLGLAWKLKSIAAFAIGQGKFLLLGAANASTLLSMMAWLGVYWAAYGWKLAALVLVSLYVHEMGHVWELKRRGFPASAPLFVPGLGAFVRLSMRPASAVEDARIGIMGPVWGLGCALASWGLWLATGEPLLMATAHLGAFLNVLNLLPVWQLDGARAFASLTRPQRALAAVALLAAFAVSREGLLLLLAVVAGVRAAWGEAAREPDRAGLVAYVALVAALTWLLELPVPSP